MAPGSTEIAMEGCWFGSGELY